jgi:two-component system sensor histidine kinase KdpD
MPPDNALEHVVFYVPLRSVRGTVGVLGVAGTSGVRSLVSGMVNRSVAQGSSMADAAGQDPQVTLFAAFCDQIALALDHIALQREAIHAEAVLESDRLKTALLGSVTHDLRTPLAAIQAAAGSLLDESVDWSQADRRTFAETIETSAERLTRLVSNLLDLSRMEAGVYTPERRWYPLGDVIGAVLDRLDLAGRTAGRRIDIDLPDDLPLAFLDHAQMEQVLTNLIENAIKYSPPGSPIRIQARAIGEPRHIEVRVVDQGIGIPEEELKAIFDKFYRVQHVDLPWEHGRPPTGTGLGLAICAGIIQAHGGRIWAESTPGQGSMFIFTLPLPVDSPLGELPADADESAMGRGTPPEPAASAERSV